MTELERLATQIRYSSPPSREEVLPYRFDDVTRLLSMLRDPEWSDRWGNIVATIGMAADKKGALELIKFIKNGPLPEGYEAAASATQLKGITALAYTIVDQDIPEVLEFLQRLTDSEYAESLNMGPGVSINSVRRHAYLSLAAAATDESMAILEGYLSGVHARKAKMSVQAHSVGDPEPSKSSEHIEKDIRMLEMYLDFGKKRRAGLE